VPANTQALQISHKNAKKDLKTLNKLIATRPLPAVISVDTPTTRITLHQLSGPEGSSDLLKLRTQHLTSSEPLAAHILVSHESGQVACALGKKVKDESAVEILNRLLLALSKDDQVKCGGSVKYAQGRIGDYTIERVVEWVKSQA
jgi:hypothetical protein